MVLGTRLRALGKSTRWIALCVALLGTVMSAPSLAQASIASNKYVATTSIVSGGRYLLESNLTNNPIGTTHSQSPTLVGSPLMNGLMIGSQDFTISGSYLTPNTSVDLSPWEFTITSAGTSDGSSAGYYIQSGSSYLDVQQDMTGVVSDIGFTITLGTVNVTKQEYVSEPFTCLSSSPRVWFWDGSHFYTKYTSDTTTVGQYVSVNPSWAGYYYNDSTYGWVMVGWNTTPWGAHGATDQDGAQYTDKTFYLMGMRPGPSLAFDGIPPAGTPMGDIKNNQYYFGQRWAVGASVRTSALDEVGAFFDATNSSEAEHINLYTPFVDMTPPVISGVPADQIVEATGPSGATVTWTAPTANDAVDGAVTPVCTPASGSTFPLGDTIVSVTATDAAGNPTSQTFKVTVQDTTAPSLSGVPADKVVEATGPSGAVVSWTDPTANDLVDGAVTPVCTPASGSTFPLGDTIVSVTATDAAGNPTSQTFKVTVQDTTAPSLSGVPADKVVEATGPSGAVVSWTDPTANDLVDGAVTPVCTPASGSTFPLGDTIVSVTATDAAGNPTSQTFKVTVQDTTAPSLSGVPSDKVVEATGASGAVVSWADPTANDAVDGAITPVCTPASGSTFPLGDTVVTVTATDTAGNPTSQTFKVTVRDTTGPVISGVPADKLLEATGPSGAVVSWTDPTANDLVDGAVTPVCTPASGSTFPVGQTTVSITATDSAGNVTTRQFKVTVGPRALRKVAAVCFGFNSSKLPKDSQLALRRYAKLVAARGYSTVKLRGYTSSQFDGGTPTTRWKLSLNRAKAVRTFLQAELKKLNAHPVITVDGYGGANPVATNRTAAGRAKNRRVELWAK